MTLSQNQIKKKYNRFSLFYDLVEWPIEKLLFSKWRKKLLKNSKGKVLEIGVGTGKNLSYYNYHKIDLTVIDISKGMLNRAKEKAKKLVIKDKLPGNWDDFYYPDELKDCFFVHDIEEGPSHEEASRIIAISKKTGEIVSDCINPEKKYSLFFS